MTSSSSFIAPIWLRNRHAQTVFPRTPFCRIPLPDYRRERLELRDGDFVDLDWIADSDAPQRPLLIVLHGLEGCSESMYARLLMNEAAARAMGGVVFHFRGCSGETNRLPRRYHAGDTDDFRYFLSVLKQRWPDRPIVACGISLGGNVLCKYLGEEGAQSPLVAAAAVCAPFDLMESARALERPGGRFYQHVLLKQMKAAMRKKFTRAPAPFDFELALEANSFYEFDDRVTAPLHGFRGVEDYYTSSSSKPYLASIAKPTLLLSAQDDPFMTEHSLPQAHQLSAAVVTDFPESGGHVGFVAGAHPFAPRYYLPEAVHGFFREYLSDDQA